MLDTAVMITADADRNRAIRFATTVELERSSAEVRSAVWRATAHGIYEARINDRPVSDAVFSPGWTSYEWRLQVQDDDVTGLLADRVRIEVLLGNGWYRGDLGFAGAHANYGEQIGVIGELVVTFADASVQSIPTSTAWTATASEHLTNSLYQGQTIDARRRGAASEPLPVREVAFDRSTLVPQVGPAVTRHEVIRPRRIWTSPSGRTLVDFGQNLTGWVRLRTSGPAGTPSCSATPRCSRTASSAPGRCVGAGHRPFILCGGTPRSERTAHLPRVPLRRGHRIRRTAAGGDVDRQVLHTDMRRTGGSPAPTRASTGSMRTWLEACGATSSTCPPTAPSATNGSAGPGTCRLRPHRLFQFDCADVLHKWLLDLADEARHSEHGWVPHVVPDVLKYADFPEERRAMAASWAGPTASGATPRCGCPRRCGTPTAISTGSPSTTPAWCCTSTATRAAVTERVWDTGFQFADWLDPDAPPDKPANAKADPGVVATASLYRSLRFAAETASTLGYEDHATRWNGLAERTREAFVDHYVSDEGIVRSDCATVYALAICFGLLDDDRRARAGDRLARLVAERGYVVTTGFAGTPFVTWALSETGHVEDAYRLLLERSCPSWLYPVTMGATTIWERWDSMLPDGTINPGEMTSFNHYALGAVADWIYQVIGGIRPAAPGYGRLLLQPVPGPGLDHARAGLDTPHGHVESGWRRDGDTIVVEVSVPEGVDAEVVLPDGARHRVGGGVHRFTSGG